MEEGEEEFEIKKIELMGSGSGASTTAQHTHTRTHEAGQHGPRGAAAREKGNSAWLCGTPRLGNELLLRVCLGTSLSHTPGSIEAPKRGHGGKRGKKGGVSLVEDPESEICGIFQVGKGV